jgi:hypothetical protein
MSTTSIGGSPNRAATYPKRPSDLAAMLTVAPRAIPGAIDTTSELPALVRRHEPAGGMTDNENGRRAASRTGGLDMTANCDPNTRHAVLDEPTGDEVTANSTVRPTTFG